MQSVQVGVRPGGVGVEGWTQTATVQNRKCPPEIKQADKKRLQLTRLNKGDGGVLTCSHRQCKGMTMNDMYDNPANRQEKQGLRAGEHR